MGDLVQVVHSTGAYVKARNTVSYIGRIVGYNNELGKWEVQCRTLAQPFSSLTYPSSLNPVVLSVCLYYSVVTILTPLVVHGQPGVSELMYDFV